MFQNRLQIYVPSINSVMEQIVELNNWKEDCRLRLTNVKRKCAILKKYLLKKKDSFDNDVWQTLEQCNKEVNSFFVKLNIYIIMKKILNSGPGD